MNENGQTSARDGRGWVDAGVWIAVGVALVALAWGVGAGISRFAQSMEDGFSDLVSHRTVIYSQPAPPSAPVDENGVQPPAWIDRPVGDYPRIALRAGVHAGAAKVKCRVSVDGVPFDCVIEDEDPMGMGFGDAALKAMGDARLTPRREQGAATEANIAFTMRFRVE